jgi:cold shock CspA family protein
MAHSSADEPPPPTTPAHRGVCTRWLAAKGFGFIAPEDGTENLFCHVSQLTDGDCLVEDCDVQFHREYDEKKGKYRAVRVTGASM